MLTNKAIFEETEVANEIVKNAKDPVQGSILKMLILLLKLLSSVRTNQVLVMEKMGVAKLDPQKHKEDEKKRE
jgi:hypothetical protein